MAAPLDYKNRSRPLYGNGLLVTALTMVGLAAEEALKVSKESAVAVGGVTERDLPASIDMKLDKLGARRVICHEADRKLGVKVASAVRVKLHALGLEVSDVVLDVIENGKKQGAHDLVCKIVTDGQGGAPGSRHPTGPLSVELKCRHLYSEEGRKRVRRELRKECGTECAWWLKEEQRSGFCGRIIIMACFDSLSSDFFTLRGDVQLSGEDFRGLFGWHGANHSLQRGLSVVEHEQPARQAEPLRRQPVHVASRVAVRKPQKLDWEAFKKKLQRDGRLKFRRARGKLVAPVLDVAKDRLQSTCQPAKARANYSLKRKVDDVLCRHSQWSMGVHVFKEARRAEKPGGSEEWVGVDRFLQDLYADLP